MTPTPDTIRRAMAGDETAARACTEAGIAIPCPHCGEEWMEEGEDCSSLDHPGSYIICSSCGARIVGGIDRKDVLAEWNRRVRLIKED